MSAGEKLSSDSESTALPRAQSIYIRPLAHLARNIFGAWGFIVVIKALYDLFWGTPEANLYSAKPWQFVTLEQWTRYAGFELSYGLSCLALAWIISRYARFLPETFRRQRPQPAISLWK